ncbi:GNAT family N-acetyltransferase [Methanospirillum lacunae]|uniref:N-acetyltransferase domain-containing protein n=1 Tax=Methanospirillum lacunae TaxID=668570 RepID=A0A2V2N801_9EURY|nr:GNAT family protein [Methanospirillum lacunae]PWR72638.1 hypothetical protein DK846_06640 [Methanospirillum lacunae]
MCDIIYKSSRISIREHTSTDLYDLHRLISNKEIMNYIPKIYCETIEETKKKLTDAIIAQGMVDRIQYYYAIESILNEYIGEIGVTIIKTSTEGKIGDLGYFLLKEYHGVGIATEAALAILKIFFEEKNFYKIESGCFMENSASEKVMIKIGMKKEKYLIKQSLHKGILKERVEYGILCDRWKDIKSFAK